MVEDTTKPTLTKTQLGMDTQYVPIQQQGSEEKQKLINDANTALLGVLYSLERDGDDAENLNQDGINRINDGDELWEKVMQLIRLLTLPSTSSDYILPTKLLKRIYKGEISTVLGSEILAEEREIVLTCILFISLCCGEAAIGMQWQHIALRLISFLPIDHIKYFLQKMELHLNYINADILKAMITRLQADDNIVDFLTKIFERQEKLKNDSTPREILQILTAEDDNAEDFGEELSKEMKFPEKVQIVILNEMYASQNSQLTKKARAQLIGKMMNKADDGTKINQYLSSGLELKPHYVIEINEHLKTLGLPDIKTQKEGKKIIYKR